MEWLSQTLTSKICPITSDFVAVKTITTLMYKILKLRDPDPGRRIGKVVRFNENPTKTRSGGLSAKHRKTPKEMWATDGGPRDLVWLF